MRERADASCTSKMYFAFGWLEFSLLHSELKLKLYYKLANLCSFSSPVATYGLYIQFLLAVLYDVQVIYCYSLTVFILSSYTHITWTEKCARKLLHFSGFVLLLLSLFCEQWVTRTSLKRRNFEEEFKQEKSNSIRSQTHVSRSMSENISYSDCREIISICTLNWVLLVREFRKTTWIEWNQVTYLLLHNECIDVWSRRTF